MAKREISMNTSPKPRNMRYHTMTWTRTPGILPLGSAAVGDEAVLAVEGGLWKNPVLTPNQIKITIRIATTRSRGHIETPP
jgi:hypothetical protein